MAEEKGKISVYEEKLLCDLAGYDVGEMSWGAAMAAALEFLEGDKLMERKPAPGGTSWVLTETGRKRADELARTAGYKKRPEAETKK